MIKCLLANNDSVMDTSLSESVLELEYLEQKVVSCDHHISTLYLSYIFYISSLSIIDNFPGRS